MHARGGELLTLLGDDVMTICANLPAAQTSAHFMARDADLLGPK